MNSSDPMYPCVLGRSGCASSHVSLTDCVRKSIQRLSAADRAKAFRREGDDMVIVSSSSWIGEEKCPALAD